MNRNATPTHTLYGPAAVTAGDLAQLIGRFALLRVESGTRGGPPVVLRFRVKILDARKVYNRVDCLVAPAGDGDGEAWVSLDRLIHISL